MARIVDNAGARPPIPLSQLPTDDLVILARILRGAGYDFDNAEMEAPLRDWQQKNGLEPTGQYDAATEAKLARFFAGLSGSSSENAATRSAIDEAVARDPARPPAAPPPAPADTSRDVTQDGPGQPATPTPATVPPPPMGPAEIQQAMREQYPAFAPFFDDPDIGPVLTRAVQEGWAPERLEAAVMATPWWQRTQESARIWETEVRTDPASARARLYETVGEIDREARRNGYAMAPYDLYVMAGNALRFAWDANAIRRAVAEQTRNRVRMGGLPAGAASSIADRLQSIAKEYMVPMARKDIEEWAVKIQDETATEDRFRALILGSAKGLYGQDPNILAALEAGEPTSSYFAPYRSMIADTLEVSTGEVDLMSPKYADVVNFAAPDGKRRPMTLAEAGRWARERPEFRNTARANEQGARLNMTLLQTFGERV